jgi:hypothetical protein
VADHAASYLLAEVLDLLQQHNVFGLLGKAKSQHLVLEIVRHACEEYDCHAGDILEEKWGPKLGICWVCESVVGEMQEGICPKCRDAE